MLFGRSSKEAPEKKAGLFERMKSALGATKENLVNKIETVLSSKPTLDESVLDDLERAFISIPPDVDQLPWVEGIKLVKRKLHSTLESQGLSPINALGEAFDPYVHEAVRQDKGKEGIVIEEVQRGYKFRDKVIRPSKVVVGNGEGEEIKEADIN